MAKRTFYGSVHADLESARWGFTWTAELATNSDTIASDTWTLTPASAGLTIVAGTPSTTATSCRVTHTTAAVGDTFMLTNLVTTAAGDKWPAHWHLTVVS